ncbi:MAG: ABC transporter permease [Bacillota bacterium]|nr:ABC transporter permease [Bacillota bacterium]
MRNTELINIEPPPSAEHKFNFRGRFTGLAATLGPVVLWMLAFFIVPIFMIVVYSFCTRDDVGKISYTFTLGNFSRFFDPMYLKILWDSLVISLATTVLCLLFGYPFAYFVARSRKKYRTILLMLIILPFWTNSLIRTYAWIILLRTEGIINTYMMNLHLIKEPLHMLYNQGAVLLGMVYTMFPFMVLPLYSTIEKLDFSLLEAASDLGARRKDTFVRVTLPLTKSGILSGCLLVFVPTLGLFFIPDLMGGSKITLVSNLIKNQFLASRNWPFGAAISIIIMLIMFLIMRLFTKLGGSRDKMEVM